MVMILLVPRSALAVLELLMQIAKLADTTCSKATLRIFEPAVCTNPRF